MVTSLGVFIPLQHSPLQLYCTHCVVAGGKINVFKTLNEVKRKPRAVNSAVGLSGLVAPTGVSVAGTKYNQNFWSRFRLFHKHFQRLGQILGLLGAAALCAGGVLGRVLDILGVGARKPRTEQRFFGWSAWLYPECFVLVSCRSC